MGMERRELCGKLNRCWVPWSQSLWGPWVLVQGLFEPSEHLWWEWGLILNVNLPLLPSCWGFSFALGHGYLLKVAERVTEVSDIV